jgi:type I restriction enzyme S subunit
MSWATVKLGELITESRVPSNNPDPDRRITVRLNVLGVEKRPLENEKAGATKQFIRKAGQFIYGKQNFHKGAFGIIPNELDGFESSADLPSFDVREDCMAEWVFYFFKQGGYYLELAKIARGVATQRIHPEQIYDLEIPLPDLDTQKNIIKSIKAIEEKGERLNNELSCQLTQLENLNQAILQEAVQGKLVSQDPNDEPASELLKRIKAEKATLRQAQGKGKKEKPLPLIKPEEIPFEIPENWVWCRLGEIAESTSGGTPDRSNPNYWNGNISWLKSGELTDDFIENESEEKITEEGFKNSSAKLFPGGTLLIALYGATAGKLGILKFESTTNQAVCGFFENKFYVTKYLFYFLWAFRGKIIKDSWGQAQPNISQTYLKNLLLAFPPLSEQKRIVAEISTQFAKTQQLKEHIIANQQATEQLLKALLHQAFEVKEMETA